MTSTDRVVLIAPAGAAPVPGAGPGNGFEPARSVEAFLATADDGGGVVVLHPALGVGDATELLVGLRALAASWTPALLAVDDGGRALWPVSLGYRVGPDDLGGDEPATILQLRPVLQDLRRARHDINNPLTSALAETQLLLMDVAGVEERESLLQIQTQLRKIRDLVEDLARFRPPEE